RPGRLRGLAPDLGGSEPQVDRALHRQRKRGSSLARTCLRRPTRPDREMHAGRDPDVDAFADPLAYTVTDTGTDSDSGAYPDADHYADPDARADAQSDALELSDGGPVATLFSPTWTR